MRFKDNNTLLKLKFLREHMEEIKAEFEKYRSETGYVLISADSHFKLVDPPRFIQREFRKDAFVAVNEVKSLNGSAVQEIDWLYYEVFWGYDWTTWHLKEIYHAHKL